MDCAELRENNLTVRKVWSHKALISKLDELRKQNRRGRAEFTRKNVEQKKKLEEAKKIVSRFKESAGANEKRQGRKRRTAEGESISGSGGSPKSSDSSEMNHQARNKGK